MRLSEEEHVIFFNQQIEEMAKSRRRYIESPVNHLWRNGKLFIGRIWGIDEVRGQLILRFKSQGTSTGHLPRLKVPYQLCVIASSAPDSPNDFKFSYDEFRTSYSDHNSRCKPVYALGEEDGWRFFGCAQVDTEFIKNLRGQITHHPMIVLAEEDPPYQYLRNLREFVQSNANNEVLKYACEFQNPPPIPQALPSHEYLLAHTLRLLSPARPLLIQGPPGTGKTHFVANICSEFIRQEKRICVTSLTNKALTEVCEKSPLKRDLELGRIFKTSLTADEERQLPGLQPARELDIRKSELLLSSYYTLSFALNSKIADKAKFDLLIIEEASQAYLATIAGFIELGTVVIILGDIEQLTPIVEGEGEVKRRLGAAFELAAKGLEVYNRNNPTDCYRITETFRLTSAAAHQTGAFYNNKLTSVSPLDKKTELKSSFDFIPHNGETVIWQMPLAAYGKELVQAAVELALDIRKQNSSFEIAVLSNLKFTVEQVYDALFSKDNSLDRIMIETIDRIQGMTCDISIIVLESSVGFALQKNRFNVVTSRAKRGTIIIARKDLTHRQSMDSKVKSFIHRAKKHDVAPNINPL